MAFPSTSVLSAFTGADENPLSEGGNWAGPLRTTAGQARRVTNQYGPPSSGTSTGESYWTPSTPGPDSEVFVTVAGLPTGNGFFSGLCARIQTPNTSGVDFYALEVVRTSAGVYTPSIYRVINGTFTKITDLATFNPTVGEMWGLEVVGAGATVTLRMWRNTGSGWVQVGSDVSDTDANRIVAAGKLGLYLGGTIPTGWRFDDFGGGTVISVTLDDCLPDADVVTTGWTATPLFSKVNDASDATVIQATAV